MSHEDSQHTHLDTASDSASPAPACEHSRAMAADPDEQHAQLLRTAAELDNLRKRTRRDIAEADRQGREAVINDLVPVLDDLDRALRHAESGPLATGVRLVEREMLGALQKHSVTRFSVERGAPFDPSRHHALDRRETPDLAPGVVAEEFAAGYMHGNRLLRPALVAVAAAPAAAASPDVDGSGSEKP